MSPDALSTTFAALADPTRRAILARLVAGEASVTDLARPFAMTLPAVSKHLRVLERAGLIARSRAAQSRPCRLDAAPLRDATGWLESYRGFWEDGLDRMDHYLRALQAGGAVSASAAEASGAPAAAPPRAANRRQAAHPRKPRRQAPRPAKRPRQAPRPAKRRRHARRR